jgi:hypothetical protein
MKAKVLKGFIPNSNSTSTPENTGVTGGMILKDAIIDVDVPSGGNKVYYTPKNSNIKTELTIGKDVELIFDEPKKGSILFFGGIVILGYIVYKLVTKK